MTTTYIIRGITSDVSVCDCCGKSNLKCTVILETNDGDTVHFGRDCAGKALYGSKSAKNTGKTEDKARMIQRCNDILPLVMDMIKSGADRAAVNNAVRANRFSVTFGVFTDTGNKMPLCIYWNGWSVPGVKIDPEGY